MPIHVQVLRTWTINADLHPTLTSLMLQHVELCRYHQWMEPIGAPSFYDKGM